MINFKGAHYPQSVILYAVYFYVRFCTSTGAKGENFTTHMLSFA
ncbi:hypothetical protein AB1E33_17290 [Ruegeria sp. 2012CJ15-1]